MVMVFAGYGLAVGVLFGFFGMGGFLVTPALLVAGYPTRTAIGSGLAFVFGTSLIATLSHRDFGQMNYRLGATLFVGAALGIELGRKLIGYLDSAGLTTTVVSAAYVVLLLGVGAFVLYDSESNAETSSTRIAARVRSISLPPRTSIGGESISLWIVVAIGFAGGILAGVLGVGGGFLLVPALVYGLGLATPVAVGTNVFQMTVSAAFGTFSYANDGLVALPVVVSLLVGSTLGARVGSAATSYVDEDGIKNAFATVLVGGGLGIASKHLAAVFDVPLLRTLSLALVFGSAVLVSGLVVVRFLVAVRRVEEREQSTA